MVYITYDVPSPKKYDIEILESLQKQSTWIPVIQPDPHWEIMRGWRGCSRILAPGMEPFFQYGTLLPCLVLDLWRSMYDYKYTSTIVHTCYLTCFICIHVCLQVHAFNIYVYIYVHIYTYAFPLATRSFTESDWSFIKPLFLLQTFVCSGL